MLEHKLCGYCISLIRNNVLLRLYSIAVDPLHAGTGVGTLLLHTLENHARKRGFAKISLEVCNSNVIAQKFYLNQGYQIFGEYFNYYQDGCSAIRMMKVL